jgi:hypothetical protein
MSRSGEHGPSDGCSEVDSKEKWRNMAMVRMEVDTTRRGSQEQSNKE